MTRPLPSSPSFSLNHVSAWMWLFLAVSLTLSIQAAIKMRAFSLPDESAHYFRTLEVSQLHIINWVGDAGVFLPCEEYKIVGNANGPIADYIDVDARIANSTPNEPCLIKSINTAGSYSPVLYVFSATGFAIAAQLGLDYHGKLTWGRAGNAIGNTLIIFLALCLVRHYRALLAAVTFIPMAFWLRASLSADAVTLSISVLFVCYLIHLVERKSDMQTRDIIALSLLGILVGSTKPLYSMLPFLTFIFINTKNNSITKPKHILLLSLPGFLSVLTAITLTKMSDPALIYIGGGLTPSKQLVYIFSHPIHFAQAFMTTANQSAGNWVREIMGQMNTIFYCSLLLILCAISRSILSAYQRLLFLLMAIGLCLASSAALYLTYTPLAETQIYGLQGRLFIAPLMIALLSIAFNSTTWRHTYLAENIIGFVIPTLLIAYCLHSLLHPLGL